MVVCILISDPPKVFLKGSQQYGLSLKTREEIRLDAFISGSPYPTVTWLRNDKVIKPEAIKRQERTVLRRKKEKGCCCRTRGALPPIPPRTSLL